MERKKLKRFVREPEVLEAIGCGRTKLDLMIEREEFPAPFRLSDTSRAKAWYEDDIIDYQKSRIVTREKGNAK